MNPPAETAAVAKPETKAEPQRTYIAEELAKKQKEISVAEFFERNKQVLGFDSPTRALITAVKEAVDNALDACEEASVLPDLRVELSPVSGSKDEFHIVVEDNGPGIVKEQIPNVFARLLYGSRFHAIRQARGQQGIGISAVTLYGQLTTGKHAKVTSKIGHGKPAYAIELAIDTKKNMPEKVSQAQEHWEKEHGTKYEAWIVGRWVGGKQSVTEYLRSTAIVNPHARVTFVGPDGMQQVFERATDELPAKAQEIKPHPYGVEMGTVLKMLRESKSRKLGSFLQEEFSSVGQRGAKDIVQMAQADWDAKPADLERDEAKKLVDAFSQVKLMSPPTDCLSPIGDVLVKRGLKKETEDVSPEFIVASSREPAVHSGHPFVIEVGIVYGGTMPVDQPVRVLRFANRVPLLYQQGGCGLTHAIENMDWRRYGLEQRGGQGVPVGSAIVAIHIASTKVPFTSEAKEAVADIPEIEKEAKLALQECARHLNAHLNKKAKRAKVREKFDLVTKIIPKIAEKSASMLGKPVPDITKVICKVMDVVWIEDSVETEKLTSPRSPADSSSRGLTAAAAGAAKVTAAAGSIKVSKPRVPKGQSTLVLEAQEELPAAESAPGEPPKPKEHWLTRSKIEIANYTLKGQKFTLYAVIPSHAVVAKVEPKPAQVTPRYIAWDLSTIKSAEKTTLTFELAGVEKGDVDENELYVDGINPIHVVGADAWYGGE